jgi:hypothetical protein
MKTSTWIKITLSLVLLAIATTFYLTYKHHDFISKELVGERNPPQYLPIADPILNEQNSIIIDSIQSNYYKLSKDDIFSAKVLLRALKAKDKELVTQKIVQASEKANISTKELIDKLIENKLLTKFKDMLQKDQDISESISRTIKAQQMVDRYEK